MSDILTYLRRFQTSDGIIDTMLRTPSDAMHIFTKAEIKELGVNLEPQVALAATLDFRNIPDGEVNWREYSVEVASTKSATPPTSPTASTPPDLRFALYSGVDFYGADVAKVHAADGGECFRQCMDHKQCVAMTFNTNPALRKGPNCFLKTGVGRTTFYNDAISGRFLLADQSTMLEVEGRTVAPLDVYPHD